MNKIIKTSTLFLVFLLLAGTTQAAGHRWQIDPAHSGIYFGVKHIYSTTNGFFEDFEGTVHFDPKDLEKSNFDFTVKVKSINTHNRKRDGHLRSDDFFSVGKYPDMTFKSTRIVHKEGNRYVVEGRLAVKDVVKNVGIPFVFFGSRAHPFNPKETVAGFEARFTIDRLAYHVGSGKFLKMGVVGRTVDIVILMEVTRSN